FAATADLTGDRIVEGKEVDLVHLASSD
ncbi:hypothetical protein LINPERHAP2_LOCUS35813, partial [Linum perenne]